MPQGFGQSYWVQVVYTDDRDDYWVPVNGGRTTAREAAAEHYGAQCAKPRRWYEVAVERYWATSRLDALDQCEDATGQRPSLDDVVEVV